MAFIEKVEERVQQILTEVAVKQNITNYKLNVDTTNNFGDGFASQFFTGEIQDKDTGKTTRIALKVSQFFEFGSNSIFLNEITFYSKAFPALDNLQRESNVSKPFDNVPTYLCGSLEPKHEYIAMKNLKPLGYVLYDKEKYLDREHLEVIFKTYGRFHALSYVLRKRDNESYQNITKDMVDMAKSIAQFMDKELVASVTAAVNALEENDREVYEELRDFGENVTNMFVKSSMYDGNHRCLVHGDCWSNNMLFKYSETGKIQDIKLLDFQICKDDTPIHDLSYFFYSGASKQDFDDLETYLRIYYDSFTEFSTELGHDPKELLSFEDLVKEWKENALMGVIFGIWIWQIKLIPKAKLQEKIKTQGNMSQEEIGKEWQKLLNEMYTNSAYQERTAAILMHAYKFGILNKDKIPKSKA